MTEPTQPVTDQTPTDRPTRGGASRRFVIVGVLVAVVLGLAGAGAFAWQKLSGGGAQPHDVLPASVIAYARLDIDPSASQKVALFRLIRKFPDAAESVGIKSVGQDVRKLVLDEALDDCDLDFDKDVEPWLGSRFGVGLLDDGATPVVAVQVTDEAKARKGFTTLAACGDGEEPGLVFDDGYAILAEDQSTAEDARKDASKAPLAEKAAFIEDFDDLGDQGIASVWLDAAALAEVPSLAGGMGPDLGSAGTFGKTRSVAMTLRAQAASMEISSIAHLDEPLGELKPAKLGTLPDSTAIALSVSGAGAQVKQGWQSFIDGIEGEGADTTSELEQFEDQTGLVLPDDLETFFGDSLTLVIGSRNLETLPMLSAPADLASLDIGLSLSSEPAKAVDLARRLVALVGDAGVPLSVTETDDGAVIATNDEAAEALSGSGTLGGKAAYKRVVPDADTAFGAIYVDVAAILTALTKADPPPDVARQIDEFKVISAVGASASRQSDRVARASLRVAFSD